MESFFIIPELTHCGSVVFLTFSAGCLKPFFVMIFYEGCNNFTGYNIKFSGFTII